MSILINGLIIDRKKAGIGQYSQNLIEGLAKNKEFDYTFLLQEFVKLQSNNIWYKKEFMKSSERISFEQLVLPFKSRKFDLIHFLDYSSPVQYLNKPFIITIHDLSFYKYPETFSTGSRKLKQFLTPIGVKRAARIITDSESTKRDIIEYFPKSADKIRVIYPAVSGYHPIVDLQSVAAVKARYNISGKYILGVGTIEPRKNLLRLIEAFKKVYQEHKDVSLVLVGKKGWLYDQIINELEDEEMKNKVVYTGYVEQEHMKYLYSGAECFVYPSLYEGFGLPPLEAMSCGVPVVVSKASSLPEVVGDAGILVDPLNIEEIAEGIKNILSDNSLRVKLIEKGLLQAQKFNWKSTVKSVVDVYKEILT